MLDSASVDMNDTAGAYSSPEEYIHEKAYLKYVNDSLKRFRSLCLIITLGELCLMFLDFQNGFFAKNSINHLNLLAELILIISSAAMYVLCRRIAHNEEIAPKQKITAIVAYRIVVMAAIVMFIFTDIYVRHKALGAYLVFLFVLQVTPAYRPRTNWIQFISMGLFTLVNYIVFVSRSLNTLFTTFVIFLCFAISADFLRHFFVTQLENYYLAEYNNNRYRRLSGQTILALSSAVEAKDPYTKGHSQRVAEYSRMIAEKLDYNEKQCREVYFIGLMHDVGKIGAPDSVINKTGRLTDDEYTEIKKHPVTGYEILKQITELPGISEGARWHHERFDGHGYPDGLSGIDIPEIARIIAVADAYDAMTSNRSYRNALPQATVREQIGNNSGSQFDPRVAAVMLELIDADVEYRMHE